MNANFPDSERSKRDSERRFHLAVPQEMEDDDTIDIRGLLLTLWRGKWIVAICVLIASVLGYLAISQLKPTYRASAKVMFDIQQTNVANLQEVVADQRFDSQLLQDQIEVLRSTTLVERVIDELNLMESPQFNPFLREPEPTFLDRLEDYVAIPPELTELAMNTGLISPPRQEPPAEVREVYERRAAIGGVLGGLGLRPVGTSRVIEISFTSGDPRMAAAIVNTVAEQYIVDQLEAKLEATRAATTWLSDRVDELRVRVEDAEVAIETARVEMSDLAGQTVQVTQQQMQALNGSLAATRARVSQLQALFDRLTDAVETDRDIGAISEFRASQLIQQYRVQEQALLSEMAPLTGRGNARLAFLERRLEEVRGYITDEAQRIVDAAELDLKAAKAQEQSLVKAVADLEDTIQEQTKNEVRLRQMDREVQASRALYTNFLGRLQETTAQEDLQEADARILTPAEVPLAPLQQTKQRTMIAAVALGAFAGIALVFLLDRLNNTFRAPAQLEEMSRAKLLGVLPALGVRKSRQSILRHLREKPASALAESIRSLRTSILFADIDAPPKVVMFTSSVPKEGKSTTSMLVALTSQQMGKSAVLVDCDLRKSVLANTITKDKLETGLMSVLEGTASVKDAVFRDVETGLHVLAAAPGEQSKSVNAADILSSKKFEALVKELTETYDLVILDTPPTLVVTDARIVSRLADSVVYVVRWDSTPRDAVLEGLKEMRSINAPITGVALTMVNEKRARRYSYDGYNYYKGKYREYYT